MIDGSLEQPTGELQTSQSADLPTPGASGLSGRAGRVAPTRPGSVTICTLFQIV